MMDLSVMHFEIVDSVGVVTMNHPPVNALGPEFLADFERILTRARKPGEVRALLLTSGCEGFFSAGDDVEALRELDPSLLDLLPRAHALLDQLETLPIPTVAAINGHALGGGLELALVCDFRFMGEGPGLIGLPEVRLGMIPALGGTQRLPLLVGKAKAIEMMFKGLQLEPAQAERIGLVNAVFPAAELRDRSIDYARRLASQATAAIASIKHCVHVGLHEGLGAGLAAEREAFRENIIRHDAREGVAAFLDGRKPEFDGRP